MNLNFIIKVRSVFICRKKKALKLAEEQIKLEIRKKEILEKEEQERRKVAEEKMRQRIIIEMEEKSVRETAEKMRVVLF